MSDDTIFKILPKLTPEDLQVRIEGIIKSEYGHLSVGNILGILEVIKFNIYVRSL